jgi:(p)ppGpp synthase/HD superfamily hydrolase
MVKTDYIEKEDLMLTQVDWILSFKAPKREFFRHIRTFLNEDDLEYAAIEKAYKASRKECKKRRREDGSSAFGHGRAVCLIGMICLGIKDPVRIKAMLLHDVVEDIDGRTHEWIEGKFGSSVVYYTRWVSKPHPEEFLTKEARDEFYHKTFADAPKDIIELKLPDVLHNLCTLFACSHDKQKRIVGIARSVYLPLAQKHDILVSETEAAIARVEAKWTKQGESSVKVIHPKDHRGDRCDDEQRKLFLEQMQKGEGNG